MAYATISDLYAYVRSQDLIDLTDDDQSGSEDTTILNEALDRATAQVDAYIAPRYKGSMPLSSPYPEILVDCVCVLTLETLYLRSSAALEDLKSWQNRAAVCRKQLEAIRDGKMELDVGQDDAPTESSDRLPGITCNDQNFTRTNLTGW
jgi:phage gp36-like protein